MWRASPPPRTATSPHSHESPLRFRTAFPGDRQFCLAYAGNWKSKEREAALHQDVRTDGCTPPTSSGAATVCNIDAWYAVCDVRPGGKLYLTVADRVPIWQVHVGGQPAPRIHTLVSFRLWKRTKCPLHLPENTRGPVRAAISPQSPSLHSPRGPALWCTWAVLAAFPRSQANSPVSPSAR